MEGGKSTARPFNVIVADRDDDVAAPLAPPEDDGWSISDLESEYLKAVEAAEQAELLSEIAFDEAATEPHPPAPIAEIAAPPDDEPPPPEQLAVETAQVLEALLFVGGAALSPRRLADVISISVAEVESQIEVLNRKYRGERRPYHIDLDDGHYRLILETDYEAIRSRVHGQGPRDVRLAPDVLEVLALVAYQQPLSKEDLEASGKPETDSIIRQLIRRDLVKIDRGSDGKQIRYGTSPRFLELFGLRSIHDLPRAEDLRFK